MQTVNRFYRFMNPSSKMRLLFLYRSISLTLTSLFFYFLGPQSPLLFKTGVVVSLCIAAWILTDLQKRNIENTQILKTIVLAETLGLTFLLIPTGGISSPFIWYALNPILVAAVFLTPLFCLGALTFYLGSATLIAYHLFHIDIIMIFQEKSYFYLVCILTTLLVWLFSRLLKELDSKAFILNKQQEKLLLVNKHLTETNEKYEETLEHIMSLYHLMDNFSSKKSPIKLISEITASLLKCTQSDSAFFWLTDLNHKNSLIANSTKNINLETDLRKEWNNLRGKREPFTLMINNEFYWMKIIRTSNNVGVLGIKIVSNNETEKTFLLNRTFEFIAELSEIMLERIHMDQMMGQMLVIEEQNRIANEIHDSVSQRLFGIVYSLHSLQVKSQTITKEELSQEYKFLSRSANTTIKELRAAIYRLSSVKNKERPFLVHLKTYLDDYARLNDIRIDYEITGDETFISNDLKSALYRIICESCGNSVRHGKCNVIELKLSVSDEKTMLFIQDDGVGIHPSPVKVKDEKGIGLLNIENTVATFSGTFKVNEKASLGTNISIEIPNLKIPREQEVAG